MWIDQGGEITASFLDDDVPRGLALAHEVHHAIGIEIVEFEVEIDFRPALVDVRRHCVPHRYGLEHGELHHELRRIEHTGEDGRADSNVKWKEHAEYKEEQVQ